MSGEEKRGEVRRGGEGLKEMERMEREENEEGKGEEFGLPNFQTDRSRRLYGFYMKRFRMQRHL